MCGLAAAFHTGKNASKPVNADIVNIYEDQVSRGTRGYGIIRIPDLRAPITVDRATEPTKALLDLYLKPAPMILFHHRTPTSSDNYLDQTHPLFVSHKSLVHDYYVMHNGTVSNDITLKEKHEKIGFIYRTAYEIEPMYKYSSRLKFNDSESLAIELARFIEGQSSDISLQGSAAVLCLQTKKDGTPVAFYFFRDEKSVLAMKKSTGRFLLGSELNGDDVPANVLYRMEIGDPRMTLQKLPLDLVAPIHDIGSGSSYGTLRTDRCWSYTCRDMKAPGSNYCKNHMAPPALPVPPNSPSTTPAVADDPVEKDYPAKESNIGQYPNYASYYDDATAELDAFFYSAEENESWVDETDVEDTLASIRHILMDVVTEHTKHAVNHAENEDGDRTKALFDHLGTA